MRSKFLQRLFLFTAFIAAGVTSFAQDPQFSMFYSVPMYLSPAFAGGRHANRATVHQRWQWPSQEARFTTTQVSFDTYVPKYNSGIGILALQDYQGGKITSTYISVNYAYELPITRNKTIRFGLQGGIIQKTLGSLAYPSDFTNDGQTGQSVANSVLMPDIGFGTIFYDRNLYVGITLNHLNRPQESLIGRGNLMPVKLTLFGGYKIPIPLSGGSAKSKGLHGAPDYLYLTPTFNYKHQGGNDPEYFNLGIGADQLDIGLYVSRSYFLAGVWYRGLPIKQYKSTDLTLASNYDAVVFLVGANYNGLGFGYSYDFTISKQQNTRTGGSHEVNLTFVFKTSRRKAIQRSLPCPDFEYDLIRKSGMGIGK